MEKTKKQKCPNANAYKAKLWLNDEQYLAVLDKALVIVTVDKNKNPIRYAIFGSEPSEGGE